MPETAPPPSPDDEVAIRIQDLVVAFGSLRAVDGLTLDVPRGRITAILGPNGAGKTTTLDVCEGLRPSTSGSVTVLGRDPWRADAAHRARIGVMLQAAGVPSGLRALEAVQAAATLYASPAPLEPLIERLGLAELGKRPYRRLSGGEKQRVGLAIALVGRPDLVILDEPTSGMDPLHRQQTWQVLAALRDQGTTVVITTHQIDEAESLADEIALIARGHLVRRGSPDSFTRGARYVITFDSTPGLALDSVIASRGSSIDEASESAPGHYRVTAATEAGALAAVQEWSHAQDAVLSGLRAGRLSLEDVVLDLVDWATPR